MNKETHYANDLRLSAGSGPNDPRIVTLSQLVPLL
jgi:hypothetical protein